MHNDTEYFYLLMQTDWFYQFADGRAYEQGRDSVKYAERSASSPIQKEMLRRFKQHAIDKMAQRPTRQPELEDFNCGQTDILLRGSAEPSAG